MNFKYATLNPLNGTYSFFDSEQEAITNAVKTAFDLYIEHTQNNPFAKISVDETGAETWHSLNGDVVLSPTQLASQQNEMVEHVQSFIDAQRMPVTNLGNE